MNKIVYLLIFLLIAPLLNFGQEKTWTEEEIKIDDFIDGTLVTPEEPADILMIFTQGSGPTDRDGNQPTLNNDGIKKISRILADSNAAATFRYDKRIFNMRETRQKESDLRFENFVNDLENIVSYFKESGNYSKIVLAGHSQGSLVSILAAQNSEVNGLISLAGPAKTIDSMIVEQYSKQVPQLEKELRSNFETLRETGNITNFNPVFGSIFKPSVQPFIHSWMMYSPSEEIKKLEIPVLIVNGTKDFQVSEQDAEALSASYPEADVKIIENMNHVFRSVESEDLLVNSKTYNEPLRPIHPELIPAIIQFLNKIE